MTRRFRIVCAPPSDQRMPESLSRWVKTVLQAASVTPLPIGKPWLQYAAYRNQGLPIGSGVTEAACKTVFTQRLKLSGMRWSLGGAQTILNLRVILLSGLWEETYQAAVKDYPELP